MAQKRRPNPLPKAFSTENESNPWLSKFKTARHARWSLNSTRSLKDMADLGFYLTALRRTEEAVEVLSYQSAKSRRIRRATIGW